jgi:hypothetical protein
MKPITVIEIAVGILGAIAVAAIAPPAYADENPYHPSPIAVSETPDHGAGTYCRIGNTIYAWTCDQAGYLGGDGTQPSVTLSPNSFLSKPSKPPCDNGGGNNGVGQGNGGGDGTGNEGNGHGPKMKS